MAKTILQGTVKGARRRGRQKKRWEYNIKEWTGNRDAVFRFACHLMVLCVCIKFHNNVLINNAILKEAGTKHRSFHGNTFLILFIFWYFVAFDK